MTVVVDTNVVVAGVLTSEPGSPPARILDAMLHGAFPFLLSVELLAEFRLVLLRPKVQRHHGLTNDEVDVLLEQLAFHGIVRDLTEAFDAPSDAGDAHLFALLAVDPRAILISGDRRTVAEAPADRGMSPREAIERGLPGTV